MLTAKKARDLTDEYVDCHLSKNISMVEEAINAAIKDGRYCIKLKANDVIPSTFQKLKELGYSTSVAEDQLIIIW